MRNDFPMRSWLLNVCIKKFIFVSNYKLITMKIKLLILLLTLAVSSCVKPSYKKNSIAKAQEEKTDSTAAEIPRNQVLSPEQQIQSATQAAPAEGREEATVYGYTESGELMTLREGKNQFICIADNPKKDGFQVVCYHKSLEPMMARGRALTAEGKSREEKEGIRAQEAKDATMPLPENPATLHIYYGEDGYYNSLTQTNVNAKYRYVVYIPYATQETTGLSLAPNKPGHPWLMFPGKYNAHIMITPQ